MSDFTPERLEELKRYEAQLLRRRETNRKWYAANKETIHADYKDKGGKEKKHEYYEKNKEKIKKNARDRYAAMKAALEEKRLKEEAANKTVGNVIAPGILDAFRGRMGKQESVPDPN